MIMGPNLTRLVALVLAVASTALAQDGPLLEFPATGEISVVFPRNETYAVEAPFPIVFGFQNSPALLSYPTEFRWTVDCDRGTFFGTGYLDGERSVAPPADPWFYINATNTLQRVREGEEDGPPGSRKGQFGYWLNYESDSCTLEWEFFFYTTCRRLADGALEISGGSFPRQKGNVTFTIAPNATRPRDAIKAYKGCALPGTAVTIAKNHTGCAEIGNDGFPEPNPCQLDVEGAASSLAEAVVAPTTSVTDMPTATTTTGSRTTTTAGGGGDPGATGDASGDGNGNSNGNGNTADDGSQATPGMTVGGVGGIMMLVAALVVGIAAPLLV